MDKAGRRDSVFTVQKIEAKRLRLHCSKIIDKRERNRLWDCHLLPRDTQWRRPILLERQLFIISLQVYFYFLVCHKIICT